MSRDSLATLLFYAAATLCLLWAGYKFTANASGTGIRFLVLAVIAWTIGRYGPWRR